MKQVSKKTAGGVWGKLNFVDFEVETKTINPLQQIDIKKRLPLNVKKYKKVGAPSTSNDHVTLPYQNFRDGQLVEHQQANKSMH